MTKSRVGMNHNVSFKTADHCTEKDEAVFNLGNAESNEDNE